MKHDNPQNDVKDEGEELTREELKHILDLIMPIRSLDVQIFFDWRRQILKLIESSEKPRVSREELEDAVGEETINFRIIIECLEELLKSKGIEVAD